MRGLKAVLLDVDGTLIYSNDEHAKAFLMAAEELGFAVPPFDEVRRRIGMGGDKLIPEAFGFESSSKRGRALDERKGEIFRERFGPGLSPTPGARDLLLRFRQAGLRLVVATSANEEDLDLLLGRAGVADLVDACTSSDDVEESKPDPDLVQAALRLAGAAPGEALMLGDTPYDLEAATRAGVGFVGVETGGWTASDLKGSLGVFATPAEILARYESGPFG